MERFIIQYPAITSLRAEYDEVLDYFNAQRVFDEPPATASASLRQMYNDWSAKWNANKEAVVQMGNLVDANEKIIFIMSAFGQLAPFTRFCAPKFGAGETLTHFDIGAGQYGGGEVSVKYIMDFTDGTRAHASGQAYDDVQQRIVELLLGTTMVAGGALGKDGLTHYT